MEINHFERSKPEWLVPRGTPFFAFGRGRILRGREGNNLLVHAYGTNSLCFFLSFFSLFFFFFLSLFSVFPFIFPFSSFFLVTPCFYFLIFKFSIISSYSPSLLLLYTAMASFYSGCHDWILLF